MIDAGIGETHLNLLLSALNIPPMSQTSMKRFERIVGKAIESVAQSSCMEAIEMEKKLASNAIQENNT